MKCVNCGTDFNGKFCPQCGTPSPKFYSNNQNPSQKRKSKKRFPTALIIILSISTIVALSVIGFSILNYKPDSNISNQTTGQGVKTTNTMNSTTKRSTTTTSATEVKASYEITYKNAIAYKKSSGYIMLQAIVVITNTGNTPLYISGSENYDLEDSNGKLIGSETMSVYPNIIRPGEKAYGYDETILDIEEVIDLFIIPRPEVYVSTSEYIRYEISDMELSSDRYSRVKLLGRVKNTTNETTELFYIVCVLFDSEDIPIGLISSAITEDIEPGEKIGFEVSGLTLPRFITIDVVARYEVFASPFQYQFN